MAQFAGVGEPTGRLRRRAWYPYQWERKGFSRGGKALQSGDSRGAQIAIGVDFEDGSTSVSQSITYFASYIYLFILFLFF